MYMHMSIYMYYMYACVCYVTTLKCSLSLPLSRVLHSRVRQNLRIVLAFPSLCDQPLTTHWKELLSQVNIYYHQPWTQRDLVNVALHHLTG